MDGHGRVTATTTTAARHQTRVASADPREGRALDADRTHATGRRCAFDASLAAVEDRVGLADLRQASLAEIAHAFEDVLAEFDPPGLLLTGFQDAAHWEAERARYERFAATAGRTIAVVCQEPIDAAAPLRTFRLGDDHPLADHWFLLALTPMVSATLIARDHDGASDDIGGERPFSAVWSFDPSVASDVCRVWEELSANTPDLQRFLAEARAAGPPAPLDHRFGQRYSIRTFERLEAARRHWRDESMELRTARRELADRSERQLKLERLASVGTLAASIAHELNNPLASITMAANVLGQLEDPDERRRMANIVESEALRAGRIAHDLLAFAADRELELSSIRLDSWLDEVAANYRSGGRPVRFTGGAEIEATIDRDRLQQVVTNLIDNALDAIDPQGSVTLELIDADDEIHITVSDDGIGIPEAILPGLFDPFVTSKPRGQGTGLGLPIARAHLQDHGGELEVVHTGPSGTRFLVRLPRVDRPPTSSPADTTAPAAPDDVVMGRVLVVDDEPPIRALLETLLRRAGWEVVSAGGLHEARRAIETMPVDVALVDVRLGMVDGPAVVAELEQLQPGIRLRSAYVTGSPPESGEVDGRPVLPKPFRWDDLPPLLDRLARG